MISAAIQAPGPSRIRACTICPDISAFPGLAAGMVQEIGEAWADFDLDEAAGFLRRPEAATLDFVAVAIAACDEDELPVFGEIVRTAAALGLAVIVIARDVSPVALHQLLSQGATGFVPFPLPPHALGEAILKAQRSDGSRGRVRGRRKTDIDRNGVVLPVQGLAGGTGATTFAVNLAWELATLPDKPPHVCLLDLDLQFGAAATYLDLPRREAVFQLLTQTEDMDSETLAQALLPYRERLSVLTAPADLVPLDVIGPADVERLVRIARSRFDYVVIDMPQALTMWTETVLQAAHVCFATLQLDMRAAQNTQRTVRALVAENLPIEKLRYVLNRAPGFGDRTGKSRVKRLSSSLDINLELQLPEGGRAVGESGDSGVPLAIAARRNPLRKEIRKLAEKLHAHNQVAEAAA